MTSAALGARLGVTPAGVRKIESSEVEGSISLKTLQRVAAALDCEVRYALVPKKTIEDSLSSRAKEVARARLNRTFTTMLLEDQAIGGEALKEQEAILTEKLLHGPKRDLWK